MDFSWALILVRLNPDAMITRRGWNGENQWVSVYKPRPTEIISQYLYLKDSQGKFIPWVPTQSDLFSEDWEEFKT